MWKSRPVAAWMLREAGANVLSGSNPRGASGLAEKWAEKMWRWREKQMRGGGGGRLNGREWRI